MNNKNNHTTLLVNNLSIGYHSKKKKIIISEQVNFSLQKGTLVSLVGINGIGKSTLLRTLAGMQKPLKGTVEILQKNYNNYSPLELAKFLSVVLTEAPVSKNLSVLELVSLGRQPYTNWIGSLSKKDKNAINQALFSTNTESLKHKKCYELSDGQLQKVMIARALAQDTPIILLDEPTTHLDLFHRASIFKLLKKLVRETNKTVLFSTHEIDLAISESDTMIVMTPQLTFFDSPTHLIEKKVFHHLFSNEILRFDESSKRFVMK